jgi:enamine deaminase RidA (YjgF/YER057c/UK114 family)
LSTAGSVAVAPRGRPVQSPPVPLELINPDELHTPQSYTHVVAATGSRLVFVAGQAADDRDGNPVAPGDLAGQAQQAFANVGRALAAVVD